MAVTHLNHLFAAVSALPKLGPKPLSKYFPIKFSDTYSCPIPNFSQSVIYLTRKEGGETVSEVPRTNIENSSQALYPYIFRELVLHVDLEEMPKDPSNLYFMRTHPALIPVRFEFPFSRLLLSRLRSSSEYHYQLKLAVCIRPTW